jgi:molybdenum cofactor biosynthesis enzyme MoaA
VGLWDLHGRRHNYLRISLTERCNLRCVYCMPAEGVRLTADSLLLSDDEIVRLASVFVSQGVDKLRLTGGEPLVRRNVVSLCARLKGLGVRDLAVTTNGLLLKRYLEPLRDAGVNLLNISLDTLVPSKFELIARRPGFDTVYESVLRAAALPGLDRVEGNKWKSSSLLPYYEMVDMVRRVLPTLSRVKSLDGANTVSKTWQVPGYLGTVGFISSMSDHFCGSCNRLRLTADGNIKACLFGSDEFSLRDLLRSGATDAELVARIRDTVQRKHAKLGGHDSPDSISRGSNRPMILIGG